MSPVFAIHLLLYIVEVFAIILFIAFPGERGKRYRNGICFGLLASPLGFVLPYFVTVLLTRLQPSLSGNVFGSIIEFASVSMLLLGPLVGGPFIVAIVAICYHRRRADERARRRAA